MTHIPFARLLLVTAAFILLSGTAYAGGLTARVRPATCDKPNFRFIVENSTDIYRKFTVVLWHGIAKDEHLKLRDRVPAHGGVRGVVSPDWERRSFYAVEVFRGWRLQPWRREWRLSHFLAGASARLECG